MAQRSQHRATAQGVPSSNPRRDIHHQKGCPGQNLADSQRFAGTWTSPGYSACTSGAPLPLITESSAPNSIKYKSRDTRKQQQNRHTPVVPHIEFRGPV